MEHRQPHTPEQEQKPVLNRIVEISTQILHFLRSWSEAEQFTT